MSPARSDRNHRCTSAKAAVGAPATTATGKTEEKTEKADLRNGLNPPGRTHHAADPRASRNDRTSLLAGHRDRLAETNPSAHQRRDRYPSTSPTRPHPPPSRPLTRTQSASTATTHRPWPARPDAAGPLPVSPRAHRDRPRPTELASLCPKKRAQWGCPQASSSSADHKAPTLH